MIKHLQIGKLNIDLVLRHRFETRKRINWEAHKTQKEIRLGVWAKRDKIVGKKDFKNIDKWNENLVSQYYLGVDLLVAKAWISFDFGGMKFNLD